MAGSAGSAVTVTCATGLHVSGADYSSCSWQAKCEQLLDREAGTCSTEIHAPDDLGHRPVECGPRLLLLLRQSEEAAHTRTACSVVCTETAGAALAAHLSDAVKAPSMRGWGMPEFLTYRKPEQASPVRALCILYPAARNHVGVRSQRPNTCLCSVRPASALRPPQRAAGSDPPLAGPSCFRALALLDLRLSTSAVRQVLLMVCVRGRERSWPLRLLSQKLPL